MLPGHSGVSMEAFRRACYWLLGYLIGGYATRSTSSGILYEEETKHITRLGTTSLHIENLKTNSGEEYKSVKN